MAQKNARGKMLRDLAIKNKKTGSNESLESSGSSKFKLTPREFLRNKKMSLSKQMSSLLGRKQKSPRESVKKQLFRKENDYAAFYSKEEESVTLSKSSLENICPDMNTQSPSQNISREDIFLDTSQAIPDSQPATKEPLAETLADNEPHRVSEAVSSPLLPSAAIQSKQPILEPRGRFHQSNISQ